MTPTDLKLFARAGAELSTLLEMTYAYQDSAHVMLHANPEAAQAVMDIHSVLTENRVRIPAQIAHFIAHVRPGPVTSLRRGPDAERSSASMPAAAMLHQKSKPTEKPLVANRITALRTAAGLTQRALGARIAATRQQIARLEAGETPSSYLAFAVAWALGEPVDAIFPDLAPLAANPPLGVGFGAHGLTYVADLPTWHACLQLRGVAREVFYDIDEIDALRIKDALEQRCRCSFINFESEGRLIWVKVSDIQYAHVIEETFTLMPGAEHDYGQLTPSHAELRLHLRGRAEPLSFPGLSLPQSLLDGLAAPDAADNGPGQFWAFDDDEHNCFCISVADLVLIEAPMPELLDEIDAAGGASALAA
ncbi:MAG: helix-turn-helix transcriptional regulator [Hyphomonadaceae bacterium]